MQRIVRQVRALAGFLSVATLLSMLILQFLRPELSMSDSTYRILIMLIAAFLGVDVLRERKNIVKALIIGAVRGVQEYEDDNDNK